MKSLIRTLLMLFCTLSVFSSCSKNNPTIFSIGDSREKVIKTVVNNFKVNGESLSKEDFLKAENGNHITLYDCEYHGLSFRKVRVYYKDEAVRKMEIKTNKENYPTLKNDLENKYGSPHICSIPFFYLQ